jgi:flagellar motor switch protein FliG
MAKLDSQKLTGPQKTAVFLLAIGEEYTTRVFKEMDDEEISKIATVMSQIDEVPPDIVTAVSDEFISIFEDTDRLLVGGESFLQTVVKKTLPKNKADAILREISDSKRGKPFVWSRDVNVEALTGYLQGEHPQTIAMVLAHLPPEISADILVGLPEEGKGDIALRIAQLGQVQDEVVRDVDEALRAGLSDMGTGGDTQTGGTQVLVDILNNADKTTEDLVMETLEEEHEELAGEIKQLLFVFEDLIEVDDRGMREILKKVESSQLTLALKTASEEMKQKIVGNLSSRASEMLLEDLEVMGPVKLSEVEEAQQEIVVAAKELEADGTITLGGKGAGDILV